jgi:cytochrome bd-type quinol oxidase subunit 1
MSFYAAIAGAIIAAVGVVLEGISCAITGIRSTKETDKPALRSTLLAASATVGFGTILFVISLVLLFMYQIKSKYVKSKGLGIAALVFGILGIILYIIGATIAGVSSQRYKDDKIAADAMKTAAILVAIGILLLIVGYIILYTVVGKKLGRASKAMKRS